MDTQYIEELKALEDKKEAKTKLIAYAEEVGAQTKKTKSFDNIVLDIKTHFEELSKIPMPEDNEGLSISDLIDAANELEGGNDFIIGADEAKPEAKLLFDAPASDEPVKIEFVETSMAPTFGSIEAPTGDKVISIVGDEIVETNITPINEKVLDEQIQKIIDSENSEIFELPENFSPHLILIGKNPGFVTVPWWIYQWISETPDWKAVPTSFKHPSAHQTLFSLIYYIKRNGSVLVRETRNSSFVTLK